MCKRRSQLYSFPTLSPLPLQFFIASRIALTLPSTTGSRRLRANPIFLPSQPLVPQRSSACSREMGVFEGGRTPLPASLPTLVPQSCIRCAESQMHPIHVPVTSALPVPPVSYS